MLKQKTSFVIHKMNVLKKDMSLLILITGFQTYATVSSCDISIAGKAMEPTENFLLYF